MLTDKKINKLKTSDQMHSVDCPSMKELVHVTPANIKGSYN